MRKLDNSCPCSSRGYILPSLVLVFALMVSIFAYNKYYRDVLYASDTEETVNADTAPEHAQKPNEEIQQLEYLLSQTRSDLELRLDALEKQFTDFAETVKSTSVTPVTGDGDNELLAHLDEWQASVNRRIGMLQDGFESSFESIESRISSQATTGAYIPAYRPEPRHIDQLEERIANLDHRLTQITDTYEARLEYMGNSLENLTAPRTGSLYGNATPAQITDQAQLLLLQDQFDQAIANYEARMKKMEMRLTAADQSSKIILSDTTKSPEMTAERPEVPATEVKTTSDPANTAMIRAANEAITAEPPAAVQPESRSDSRLEMPAKSAQKTALRQNVSEETKPATTSGWSVNLASYARKEVAEDMLEKFVRKGVAAEMLATKVQEKTMYRLRVTGFDSIESARSMTPVIKQKLGLLEVWISRI